MGKLNQSHDFFSVLINLIIAIITMVLRLFVIAPLLLARSNERHFLPEGSFRTNLWLPIVAIAGHFD